MSSPMQNRLPLTSFGPQNSVNVETAVILRRLTNADIASTRPVTAAQLEVKQSLLPRTIHSADVLRKREQLHRLESECATAVERAKQTESKFVERLPLVHLGIDLKMSSEPILSVLPTQRVRSAGNGKGYDATPKKQKTPPTDIFSGFAEAKEAAAAINAVDNLLPHVVQQHPYLQLLREQAEVRLRSTAEKLVQMSSRNAHEFQNESPQVSNTRREGSQALTDAELMHHDAIFAEWSSFIEVCQQAAPGSSAMDDDTKRELFIAFVRSKGALPLPGAASEEGGVEAEDAKDATALDDLAPPSGGLCPVVRSTQFSKAKMMYDVNEKEEHLNRLVEQAALGSAVLQASPEPKSQQPEGSTGKSKLASPEDVQQHARQVFTKIAEEQRDSMKTLFRRQLERQHQQGVRLSRRGNLDLYRQHQQSQHQLGLLRAAERSLTKEIHRRVVTPIEEPSVQQYHADAPPGPPAATHKLKLRGSSAKSRPSSGSTAATSVSPRSGVIVAELPTVTTRTIGVHKR